MALSLEQYRLPHLWSTSPVQIKINKTHILEVASAYLGLKRSIINRSRLRVAIAQRLGLYAKRKELREGDNPAGLEKVRSTPLPSRTQQKIQKRKAIMLPFPYVELLIS